jgi:hypothetical protein
MATQLDLAETIVYYPSVSQRSEKGFLLNSKAGVFGPFVLRTEKHLAGKQVQQSMLWLLVRKIRDTKKESFFEEIIKSLIRFSLPRSIN